MPTISVREVHDVDDGVLEGVRRLLPQLSGSAPPLTVDDLAALVATPSTRLLLASDDGRVVGMLTLVLVRLTTGLSAHVEDVVVDASARGTGVGRLLAERAVELARSERARQVDLTSRPARVAANTLYQSMGFVRRDTNVYRLSLATDPAL